MIVVLRSLVLVLTYNTSRSFEVYIAITGERRDASAPSSRSRTGCSCSTSPHPIVRARTLNSPARTRRSSTRQVLAAAGPRTEGHRPTNLRMRPEPRGARASDCPPYRQLFALAGTQSKQPASLTTRFHSATSQGPRAQRPFIFVPPTYGQSHPIWNDGSQQTAGVPASAASPTASVPESTEPTMGSLEQPITIAMIAWRMA